MLVCSFHATDLTRKHFSDIFTFKIIWESKFQFQTSGSKSNHWFKIKLVQGGHSILQMCNRFFWGIHLVKTRPALKTRKGRPR